MSYFFELFHIEIESTETLKKKKKIYTWSSRRGAVVNESD